MNKIITILIILILAQTTLSADLCNNVYYTPSTTTTSPSTSVSSASGDDTTSDLFAKNDATLTGTTEASVTSGTTPCTDTEVYGTIKWTVTDPDTNSPYIANTNEGMAAVAGQEDYNTINVNFYNPDGTVQATYSIDYPDTVSYIMTKAEIANGGIILIAATYSTIFIHHIKSTGEQWQNAYYIDDDANMDASAVSSNNGYVEAVFMDYNTYNFFDLSFDLTDGSIRKSVYYSSSNNYPSIMALYQDASQNGYITIYAEDGSNYPAVLLSTDDDGTERYERKLSTDDLANGDPTDIIPFETYLCFGAPFTNYYRIFCFDSDDGVVDKEIRYDTSIRPREIAANTNTLFITGLGDTYDGFCTSYDYDTSTTNWNYNYEDDTYAYGNYDVAVGENTIGLIGMGNTDTYMYITLLDLATGDLITIDQINIEGHSPEYHVKGVAITPYSGDLFYFTGYDLYQPESGYTGLFGITSPLGGPVPEFSISTLLLATLLAGGLVLLVIRRNNR